MEVINESEEVTMLEEEIKKVRVREKGIERKRVMDRRRGQFSHLTIN